MTRTVDDPDAALERVLTELDRPRWRSREPIPPCDMHEAICRCIFQDDGDGGR